MNASADSQGPRVLLVGIGNPLRSDDAVGRVVAERAESLHPDRYTALVVHQLTPDLAADLADYERVVFVDASMDPEVDAPRLRAIAEGGIQNPPALPHALEPEFLLELSARCFVRRPQAWKLEIPALNLGHGTNLSPEARAHAERALALLATPLPNDDVPSIGTSSAPRVQALECEPRA